VVRIDGIAGDRYISDVLGTAYISVAEVTSGNYVPGVSGFDLNADGTAEFNDVTIRGDVEADSFATVGTSRIEIGSHPGGGGIGAMFLYSGNVPVAIMYGTSGGGVLLSATNSSGTGVDPYLNMDDGSATLRASQSIFLDASSDIQLFASGNLRILNSGGTTTIDNVPSMHASSKAVMAGSGWSRGNPVKIDAGSASFSGSSSFVGFNESFSGVFSVVAVLGDDNNGVVPFVVDDSVSTSGFSVIMPSSAIWRVNWIALGW
jgi:hypothetical protein